MVLNLSFSGAGMLFQALAIGLGTLLFWVPFLDAPLPGTVPLYKKWYGWVMLGIILFLFSIVYNYIIDEKRPSSFEGGCFLC